ncbi:MAG: TetR/AcrR family transcriptional regulator [Pseudanabaenales cyanobacterium]|nr:TetR/AcrR family transcriptional regulator [Pseudanabaenales cyanobacterium]
MHMSKEDAIAQFAKVFRKYGYEGATLTRLSKAAGLGKASLYHHFPRGKEEMAEAVLNYVNHCFQTLVLEPLQGPGKPAERIYRMSQNIREFYRVGQDPCLLSILTLGDAKDLFDAPVKRAFETWLDTLAGVLVEAGCKPAEAYRRAEDAIIQIQGVLVLSRSLDSTDTFERVITTLPDNLLKD